VKRVIGFYRSYGRFTFDVEHAALNMSSSRIIHGLLAHDRLVELATCFVTFLA
jgi:hypothetical protein